MLSVAFVISELMHNLYPAARKKLAGEISKHFSFLKIGYILFEFFWEYINANP